jgi:Tol biopolymer transport system component
MHEMSSKQRPNSTSSLPVRSLGASPQGRRGRLLLLFAALLGTIGAVAPVAAASTRLSDGHPFSDVDFSSTRPRLSPDGLHAVYRQDAVTDGASELWSVALPGGDPVRLSDILTAGQLLTFAISPDSSRVVYTVDQDTLGITELFSVPIGGGVITKLNPSLAAGRNVISFLIAPGSNRVFYVADRGSTDNKFELYTVPITGGASIRLNADLPSSDHDVEAYQVSPNGATVVYRMGRTALGIWELWSVPATGSADSAEILNGALSAGGAVDGYFQISPDSSTVVYRADATIDETYDLYSAPIGGGASVKLNSTLPTAGSVDSGFLISPNGSRVVFRTDLSAFQTYNLYSVPIGGGFATRLNGALAPTEDVSAGFLISPNSSRVIYRSDEDVDEVVELYSVPIAGGTATRLNASLAGGGDVLDFAVSPDGSRVVYRADRNVDTVNELFSVPIGGGTSTKLNRTLVAGGDVVNYRISSNNSWVVYGADQDQDGADELLRVPLGGGAVENASGPLVPGGDVVLTSFQAAAYDISPVNNYDVLYAADEDTNDQVELYLSGVPEASNCPSNDTTLCLQDGKFSVTVHYLDFLGRNGFAHATQLSNESGDFWFFGADNNEMIVKILDGCGSNSRHWVFWRALSNVEMDITIRDTETLQTVTYHNPLGTSPNGHLDIDTIFHCNGAGPATEHFDTSTDLPPPGVPHVTESLDPSLIAPCIPDGDRSICLKNGRFRIQGTWRDFAGNSGYAHMIKKNEGSGYAWFFNSNSYELLFKQIDGCSLNGNTWVSVAGLTNVESSFTITDTWTGAVYRQDNGLGVDFPTNLDIDTNFTYCPPAPLDGGPAELDAVD